MFKNTSIKTKLFLPISILIFIFIVLTSSIIYTHYSKTKSLKALENRIILATQISKVLHETQRERGITSGFLTSHGKNFQKDLLSQRELSNKKLSKLKRFLTIENKNIKIALQVALQDLQKLHQVRDRVNTLSVTPNKAITFYSALNEKFLNVIIEISKTSKLPSITQNIMAYSDFFYAKENLGRMRAVGISILYEDTITKKMKMQFEDLISIQKQYRKQFFQYVSKDAKRFLKKTLQNKSYAEEIKKLRSIILNPKQTAGSRINPEQWFKHITSKIDGLKIVDQYLEEEIISNIEKELYSTYLYFGIFAFLNIIGILLFIAMINILVKLLKDEKRLKAIMDKYIISSTTNLKGIITFASEGFCRTSGYSNEELVGKPHNIVRHPDMPQSAFQEMWNTIQKGRSWNGRVKNRTKDGGSYWVYAYIEPLFDKKNKIEGYMAVRLNISESIELEDKIKDEIEKNKRKEQAMLQQSRFAQMGEMISMIAHQWRQPLAAISAISASLEMKANLNKLDNITVQQKTRNISDLSQHLSHTIDDFRNFFKPNKEKRETHYSEIVSSVLDIMGDSIHNKNIQIIQELNCHESFSTYTNELRQVVLNLIKNAEDVLVDKKVEDPYIKIATFNENNNWILTISDNGGGIPEAYINKVFDPYFSTKEAKDGTGLGLYMSKTIIEDHCGGEISVSNTVEGAVFKIMISEEKDKDEYN